jgi:hypothetical protein
MVLVALLAFFLRFGVPILAVLALAAVLARLGPRDGPPKGEIVDREL